MLKSRCVCKCYSIDGFIKLFSVVGNTAAAIMFSLLTLTTVSYGQGSIKRVGDSIKWPCESAWMSRSSTRKCEVLLKSFVDVPSSENFKNTITYQLSEQLKDLFKSGKLTNLDGSFTYLFSTPREVCSIFKTVFNKCEKKNVEFNLGTTNGCGDPVKTDVVELKRKKLFAMDYNLGSKNFLTDQISLGLYHYVYAHVYNESIKPAILNNDIKLENTACTLLANDFYESVTKVTNSLEPRVKESPCLNSSTASDEECPVRLAIQAAYTSVLPFYTKFIQCETTFRASTKLFELRTALLERIQSPSGDLQRKLLDKCSPVLKETDITVAKALGGRCLNNELLENLKTEIGKSISKVEEGCGG